MNSNILEYKGYFTKIEYSAEDKVLYPKLFMTATADGQTLPEHKKNEKKSFHQIDEAHKI